jgi:hypothetical protein
MTLWAVRSEVIGLRGWVSFDVLQLRGRNLRPLPLVKRKAMLQKELRRTERIVYCQHVGESGEKLFQAADQLGLEGVGRRGPRSVAVAPLSSYRPESLGSAIEFIVSEIQFGCLERPLMAYSVEKLQIARTENFRQIRIQSKFHPVSALRSI